MNNEQIYWLYGELKDIVRGAGGIPINLNTEADIYLKIEDIFDIAQERWGMLPNYNKELREYIFRFVKIVQSAMALNKPL